jgi:hypothetical protein
MWTATTDCATQDHALKAVKGGARTGRPTTRLPRRECRVPFRASHSHGHATLVDAMSPLRPEELEELASPGRACL